MIKKSHINPREDSIWLENYIKDIFSSAESDPSLTTEKRYKTTLSVRQNMYMALARLDLVSMIVLLAVRSIICMLFWVAGIRPKWPELGQGPISGHF